VAKLTRIELQEIKHIRLIEFYFLSYPAIINTNSPLGS
jgi:hypothetical protein